MFVNSNDSQNKRLSFVYKQNTRSRRSVDHFIKSNKSQSSSVIVSNNDSKDETINELEEKRIAKELQELQKKRQKRRQLQQKKVKERKAIQHKQQVIQQVIHNKIKQLNEQKKKLFEQKSRQNMDSEHCFDSSKRKLIRHCVQDFNQSKRKPNDGLNDGSNDGLNDGSNDGLNDGLDDKLESIEHILE